MSVPKYDEMYNEFLKVLEDGNKHEFKEIRENISKILKLKERDLKETLNSGKNVFYNRVGWTSTYLKKAGMIDSPKRAVFFITKEGKKLLDSKMKITNEVLSNYESFINFIGTGRKNKNNENVNVNTEYTPQEEIDNAINKLNKELADDLLQEILNQNPFFLEELSVKLVTAMGYGKTENSQVTSKTGDEGIDGIVLEDELGINVIYIQAKRYDVNSQVSRPELQKFVGAMAGKNVKKGVFITTSYFGRPAIEYAKNQDIVLIDGEKLVELMIKYNVGCYTESTYSIKKLDLDFFENV